MKRNNPFQLKEGGQLLTFPNIGEFYLYSLKLIYKDFPAGFIDYYVFLYDHNGERGKSLREICMKVQEGWEDSQFFSLKIDWNDDVLTMDRLGGLFERLTQVMSNYEFDQEQFITSYLKFKNGKEKRNGKADTRLDV